VDGTDFCSVVRKAIQRLRCEDGQALVELAFVLPLILLFLFGIIDFGLAINSYNGDTNLANLGARTVAVLGTSTSVECNGTSETSLTAWMDCEAKETGAPTPTAVYVCDTAGSSPSTTYTVGDPIKVEVASAFDWTHILTGSDAYVGSVTNPVTTITASATMRLEQAPSSGSTANSFLSATSTCPS